METVEKLLGFLRSRTILSLLILAYIIVNPDAKDYIGQVLPDVLDVLGEGNNPELILAALAAIFRINPKADL